MAIRVNTKGALGITFLVICIVALGFGVYNKLAKPNFEYEGWISCMPGTDVNEEHSKLCEQAEKANYPYIAY